MPRWSFLAVCAVLLLLSGPAFAECSNPDNRPNIADTWKGRDGKLEWPPNSGAVGTAVPVVLPSGMLIDRFGCEGGSYFSPRGVSFGARALPYVCETSPYFVYRVAKPVVAWTARILPWFDQKGGGTQFQTDATVAQLLSDGVIEKIAADRPACGQ